MATDHQLSFAVRSGKVEVGILGAEIVVRDHGFTWGRLLRDGLHFLAEGGATEARIPLSVATAHYSGGVLRVYRLGQPWLVLEA
jgi:hypothetical protein